MGKLMPADWNRGSTWYRWDPHLHAPGTLRNDQFGGDWEAYVRRIEAASPAPMALGITDYFTLRGYKEVVRRRQKGALANVALVFPNVELRLTLETKRRQGINLHFLVSPEDPDHVALMEEKLAVLRFPYRNDTYPCSDDGLKRLGRAHRGDPNLPDEAALSDGANQFKVELGKVRELYEGDRWVQQNVLIAVAAGEDGLAGLSEDAAFHAQREELGRFAHIVFSGSPGERAYWIGDHPDFEKNGHKPKPCLHGSDAHQLDDVLRPHHDRRCWIRAEPTFDGLRQTLAEPARRVHIGPEPPESPSDSDVIRFVRFRKAPWIENQQIELNHGLVTVIGARGSGKTALADLIALATDADEEEPGDASFLRKAGPLLVGVQTEVEWADGIVQSNEFPRDHQYGGTARVRYLSQKFVENLCSPGAVSEPLNDEIEHVVFSAIPEEDRLQCLDFAELRDVLLADPRAQQRAERQVIRGKTSAIADETKLRQSVVTLKAKLEEAERKRKALEAEFAKIPVKGNEAAAKAYDESSKKLSALREAIAAEQRREKSLQDLGAEVRRYEREVSETWLRIKTKYDALLDDAQWEQLRASLPARALPLVGEQEQASTQRVAKLRESGVELPTSVPGAAPAVQGLKALEAQCEALTKALGLDKANAKRRVELDAEIPKAKQEEDKARVSLGHAETAGTRIKEHHDARLQAYEQLFLALAAEERALRDLYRPLHERLGKDPRLQKLSFTVQRFVDVAPWAEWGERLFDLRKPPFAGSGVIKELATKELLTPWTSGSPVSARSAMQSFLENHVAKAMNALAQDVTPLDVGEWLFSTEHIAVHYGIHYEGLGLGHLSPGTRGVVLLTLYLALDQWDHRPLVIDQPEENLDPRSVYDDLVPFFREASRRRQIIMVTHNANLVVNTDSDQVIVSESTRTSPAELPYVRYTAGGLELPAIRKEVCRLLEGGREAFERRRQRYSIK